MSMIMLNGMNASVDSLENFAGRITNRGNPFTRHFMILTLLISKTLENGRAQSCVVMIIVTSLKTLVM